MADIGGHPNASDRFRRRAHSPTLPSFDPLWDRHLPEETTMAWKTPKITVISVGMEINCYACAEL